MSTRPESLIINLRRLWQHASTSPIWLALAMCGVSLGSALPFAGSWNDGSRLAAVESIGDHRSLAVDRSVFVRVPPELIATSHLPYPSDRAELLQDGTKDRLLIGGHYYSDKPAIISLLMAGWYRVLQAVGLPQASERPDQFAYAMTVSTSGAALVVTACCVWILSRRVGLPPSWCLTLGLTSCLCTVALPYVRHVNNHEMLLAVLLALLVQLDGLAREGTSASKWRLVAIGTLGGLGYNLDLGGGPILVGCLVLYVAWRCRRVSALGVMAVAVAPWVVGQLAINYAIGGVLKPMNMVAEYSDWPGSPFHSGNLTGFVRRDPLGLTVFGLSLLFGKHGFFVHNLPTLLALPGLVWMLRSRPRELPELLFGAAWCCGTWIMYSLFASHHGGACCSVRWFVPFIGPYYHLIAVALRDRPAWRPAFLVLCAGGGLLGCIMWFGGPWTPRMVPLLWPISLTTCATWLVVHHRLRRRQQPRSSLATPWAKRNWLWTPGKVS